MGISSEWASALTAWTDYLRTAGAPDTTIDLRTYHLGRLARDMATGPGAVTFEILTAWLASQQWAPNTRRSYRGSLRSFYGWAIATGLCMNSPAHLLPPVPVPRGRPRPAPEEAYHAALDVADERARLAIMLAACCGLRRSEIAQVRGEDLEPDLLGRALRVHGKGGHIRLVPLTDELADDIAAHGPGWLFPSTKTGSHLTPHHLGKIVSACLPGTLTTHTLRHRCGTVSYARTRDLRAVQELLGHAKPETTALYTQIPGETIRRAMEAAAA